MSVESSQWTKTQLAVFFVIILLSIDEINPVKVILHVFPTISSWHVATGAGIFMLYIFISDVKALLYFGVKVFFHSILSIFLRLVEVVGRENIPQYGPVIFTVNHANQFMDAVMVVCSCKRQVSYLMAEASWKRRIIGDFAWALGVVPVRRAQDDAKHGSGKIRLRKIMKGNIVEDQNVVKGEEDETILVAVDGIDTKFHDELKVGDKIRPPGTAFGLKVRSIESDSKMIVDAAGMPEEEFPVELFEEETTKPPVSFDLLRKTPLTTVFEKVLDRLAGGGAVGIFPEGGSHDRTDLLPLKVGIALIAYSALEKDGIAVPIVPVGLSYFGAHRWRGRAVVEYGRPINIDPSTLDDFKAGGARRRKVCNNLLEEVETSMRSVIVTAPDYEALELIHTARRLYKRKKGPMDTVERQDLSRRFVEGYKRLLMMSKDNPNPEWMELQNRIVDYRNELIDLGLKDYQVPALKEEHLEDYNLDIEHVDGDNILRIFQLAYNIAHKLILIGISTIPMLLLNLPVGVMAGLYAESRRKKALARSKVKIKGYDVMLTEKIVFCIVMVPSLWMIYGLYLFYRTELETPTIAVIMLSMPIFAYTGIAAAEESLNEWFDLRPFIMRILPGPRKRLAVLPAKRKKLQDDLRAFIREVGPTLGDLYYPKDIDWTKVQAQTKRSPDRPKKTE